MTLKNRFFTLAKKHKLAVVLLSLESIGSAILTAIFIAGIVSDFQVRPEIVLSHIADYVALCAIFLLATLMFFFITRQLVYSKRWARSAAVFAQLIQIAIAWNSFTGDPLGYFFGGWLIATSASALYFLFSKDVIEATVEKIDRD
jgi:hypothetical protein